MAYAVDYYRSWAIYDADLSEKILRKFLGDVCGDINDKGYLSPAGKFPIPPSSLIPMPDMPA